MKDNLGGWSPGVTVQCGIRYCLRLAKGKYPINVGAGMKGEIFLCETHEAKYRDRPVVEDRTLDDLLGGWSR